MKFDPLTLMARCRAELIANKSRDFAAEYSATRVGHEWPEQTHQVLSITAPTQQITMLSADDFNKDRRAWERSHDLMPRYRAIRSRAMRPVSGLAQADMLAMATRCVTAADEGVAAWSAAA